MRSPSWGRSAQRCGMRVPGQKELELFMQEATAGDYDDLLRTVMRWVVVE
jgi:hypothetical protein